MPPKVETQVGEALEEAELVGGRARECVQDHGERREFALHAPAGHRNSELGALLARGTSEHLVPDMSVAVFALSDIPIHAAAHAGAAILVAPDVAHGDTPRRPAGRFQLVAPPQIVPMVKLTRLFHYPVVWCAGVRRIASGRHELVGR
jgi:hypothetical protein